MKNGDIQRENKNHAVDLKKEKKKSESDVNMFVYFILVLHLEKNCNDL